MSGQGSRFLRQLAAVEARGTLAHRLHKTVDRIRQGTAVKLGVRPYNVFLVWTRWTGQERGEGRELVCRRIPIVPNPKIEDLSSIALNPFSAGTLPVGAVRVTEISMAYTSDQLLGKWVPEEHEDVPEPYEFFWEIVEDGRGDDPAARAKFRTLSTPFRKAEAFGWTVLLERMSEDLGRDGRPVDVSEEG